MNTKCAPDEFTNAAVVKPGDPTALPLPVSVGFVTSMRALVHGVASTDEHCQLISHVTAFPEGTGCGVMTLIEIESVGPEARAAPFCIWPGAGLTCAAEAAATADSTIATASTMARHAGFLVLRMWVLLQQPVLPERVDAQLPQAQIVIQRLSIA
jgi:hypothetical protein